jgi:hypothetical protein
MQDNDGVIKTDKFTLIPSSIVEIKSFLNAHLGDSFIEIINIEHYQCECNVKTADGDRIVLISLPASIMHKTIKELR